MPAVSILVPVRNAAATLDAALESLVAQTLTDWEAILVDDASTDGSAERLEAWTRRDRRFRLLRNAQRLGIVGSLERARAAARAPLLARMDADDLALPQRLERQRALLEGEGLAAVGCRVRYFPEKAVGSGARRYEAWLNSLVRPEEHARDLFVECPLAHPTLMLRAEAAEAVGGYRACGWPEDYDLLLRLALSGRRMAKVPEVLLLWREGSGRASRTLPEYAPEAFARCKAHHLRRSVLAGGRPALLFGAGPVGKRMARALLAEGVPLAAFVDVDPRRIGQRIYGVPVLEQAEGVRRRGEAFGLAAVGQPGQREVLRRLLSEAGWREGEEFVCVA